MALIPFITRGLVYDTAQQTGYLNQVVERFMLGNSIHERCVIVDVACDESGFRYTLIGFKSLERFTTQFIFEEKDTASGVYADSKFASYMTEEKVKAIIAEAEAAEQERLRQAAVIRQYLHRGIRIVEYSEKALAIFTEDVADIPVLERIRAKRNAGLMYEGRKTAGWIIPKSRQAQLAAVVQY